jgi:hypothetical protein
MEYISWRRSVVSYTTQWIRMNKFCVLAQYKIPKLQIKGLNFFVMWLLLPVSQ